VIDTRTLGAEVGGGLEGKDGMGVFTNLANETFPTTNFTLHLDMSLKIGMNLGQKVK